MIVAVYFHRSIDAFEHNNGNPVDEWILANARVRDYGVTCTEKGNAYLFEWISRADRTKGKRKRVKVPLTNVSAVLEVEDVEPEPAPPKGDPKLDAGKTKP